MCDQARGPDRESGPEASPLTRILPKEPQALFVTGGLGDANLSVFSEKPTPVFELRHLEASGIHGAATA